MLTVERLHELQGDLLLIGRSEREVLGMLLIELTELVNEVTKLRQRVEELEQRRRRPRKPQGEPA